MADGGGGLHMYMYAQVLYRYLVDWSGLIGLGVLCCRATFSPGSTCDLRPATCVTIASRGTRESPGRGLS